MTLLYAAPLCVNNSELCVQAMLCAVPPNKLALLQVGSGTCLRYLAGMLLLVLRCFAVLERLRYLRSSLQIPPAQATGMPAELFEAFARPIAGLASGWRGSPGFRREPSCYTTHVWQL